MNSSADKREPLEKCDVAQIPVKGVGKLWMCKACKAGLCVTLHGMLCFSCSRKTAYYPALTPKQWERQDNLFRGWFKLLCIEQSEGSIDAPKNPE